MYEKALLFVLSACIARSCTEKQVLFHEYNYSHSCFQVGSYSYDMTKMLFKVSKLTFIQKQSIILDYSIDIRNLREKDKIFLAGALGNYSLAGFEMVSEHKNYCTTILFHS